MLTEALMHDKYGWVSRLTKATACTGQITSAHKTLDPS